MLIFNFHSFEKLNEKEASYLEERIKRTGKKEAAPVEKAPIPAKERLAKERPKTAKMPAESAKGATEVPKVDATLAAARALVRPSTAPNIKREFELDFKSIEGDEDVITGSVPKLKSVNLNDVLEAASIPTNLKQAYNTASRSSAASGTSSVRDIAELLDLTIAQISSTDIQVAMEALVQLEDVFKKKKTDDAILKRIDQVYFLHVFSCVCNDEITHIARG